MDAEKIYYVKAQSAIKQARENITDRIAEKIGQPRDSEAVQNIVNAEYIGINLSRSHREIGYEIHPAAVADIDVEMAKIFKAENDKKAAKGIKFISARWGVRPHDQSQTTNPAIKQARENILERIAKERGLSPDAEAVQNDVDKNYISMNTRENGLNVFKIYPSAIPEIDAQMKKLYPDRSPKEVGSERSR